MDLKVKKQKVIAFRNANQQIVYYYNNGSNNTKLNIKI